MPGGEKTTFSTKVTIEVFFRILLNTQINMKSIKHHDELLRFRFMEEMRKARKTRREKVLIKYL